MLNPALQRHLLEARLIGQLVLAYGELEMMVAVLLGNTMGNRSPAFKMMFRIVGELARIGAADAMMRDKYSEVGLETEYAEAIAAVRFCVGVRNQFAHCHWGDDIHAGLFFTNLQEPAKASQIAGLPALRSPAISLGYKGAEYVREFRRTPSASDSRGRDKSAIKGL